MMIIEKIVQREGERVVKASKIDLPLKDTPLAPLPEMVYCEKPFDKTKVCEIETMVFGSPLVYGKRQSYEGKTRIYNT